MFHFLLSLRDLKTNKNSNINPFSANVPLLYPLKHQKTGGFLMFSAGIEVNIG